MPSIRWSTLDHVNKKYQHCGWPMSANLDRIHFALICRTINIQPCGFVIATKWNHTCVDIGTSYHSQYYTISSQEKTKQQLSPRTPTNVYVYSIYRGWYQVPLFPSLRSGVGLTKHYWRPYDTKEESSKVHPLQVSIKPRLRLTQDLKTPLDRARRDLSAMSTWRRQEEVGRYAGVFWSSKIKCLFRRII